MVDCIIDEQGRVSFKGAKQRERAEIKNIIITVFSTQITGESVYVGYYLLYFE